MKLKYSFVLCLPLAGTVLAAPAPQGDPVVAALASCTCDTEIFSFDDLQSALRAAVKKSLLPPAGVKTFPHIFNNNDELHFPWCTRFPEFASFPLTKPTFVSGKPGPYRIIYDTIGQKICGCVKHVPAALGGSFDNCQEEGDPPPSISTMRPPPVIEPPPKMEPPPKVEPHPISPEPLPLIP